MRISRRISLPNRVSRIPIGRPGVFTSGKKTEFKIKPSVSFEGCVKDIRDQTQVVKGARRLTLGTCQLELRSKGLVSILRIYDIDEINPIATFQLVAPHDRLSSFFSGMTPGELELRLMGLLSQYDDYLSPLILAVKSGTVKPGFDRLDES